MNTFPSPRGHQHLLKRILVRKCRITKCVKLQAGQGSKTHELHYTLLRHLTRMMPREHTCVNEV